MFESNVDYFVCCDAEKIPFVDGYFDWIITLSMIHHLPNPDEAFSEICRVLKPEGTYIGIGEPVFNPLSYRILSKFYPPVGKVIKRAKERERQLGVREHYLP